MTRPDVCADPECGHSPEQHAYTMIAFRGWCEWPGCRCGWWRDSAPEPLEVG